jgi:hypothetical protein
MTDQRLPLVSLTMSGCQLDQAEPARQVLSILHEEGCEFLFGRKPDPNPERRIRQGSIISSIGFTHARLARSLESRVIGQKLGVGSLGYIAGRRTAMIFQMPDRSKDLDKIAAGSPSWP